MSAEVDSPFGILPIELKWKIFAFLNNIDKKKSRLVCSHWRMIIDENLSCRVLLSDKTQSLILSSSSSSILKSLTVKNLTKMISMSSLHNTIPRIEECVIGPGNSSINILNIFRFYSNKISSLRIQNLSLSNIKTKTLSGVLRHAEWSNLSSLSVTMRLIDVAENGEMNCKHHVQAIAQIMKSTKIPTLRNLTINFSKGYNFVKPWIEIFDFVLNHGHSLRELNFVLTGMSNPPPLRNYKKFSQFKNLNLKKFRIKFDAFNLSYAEDLCLLIEGLEELEVEADCDCCLIFQNSNWNDNGSGNWREKFKFDKILDLHKETLRTLHCQFVTFDLGWLKGFNSLKILELNIERFYFKMTPSLQGLRKFHLLANSDRISNSESELLIRCIVDQMPNLVEVAIAEFKFQVSHLKIIKELRGIRNLIVGSSDYFTEMGKENSMMLRNFCLENPGLSYRIENPEMIFRNRPKFLNWLKRTIIQFSQVPTV